MITNTNSGALCGGTNSSMELYRLLGDVISNSDSRNDRCGSIYDTSKMCVEPVFRHKINTKPNSDDGIITVSLSINQANYTASQSSLLVVCLYDEVLKLDYDGQCKVMFTDLIS